eukprot:CFRG6462T1
MKVVPLATADINVVKKGIVADDIQYLGTKVVKSDSVVATAHELVKKARKKCPRLFKCLSKRSPIKKVTLKVEKNQFSVYEYGKDEHSLILVHAMSSVYETVRILDTRILGIVVNDDGVLVMHGFITKCLTQTKDLAVFFNMVFNVLEQNDRLTALRTHILLNSSASCVFATVA